VSITTVVVLLTRNPGKLSFAVFWIFYNFIEILQDLAKCQILLKIEFPTRSLEFFRIHTKTPGKNGGDAIGSSGCGWRGSASNPARAHWSPTGEGRGEGLGFARSRFGPELGVEKRPTAVGGGRRGSSCSGEPPAGEKEWAAWGALRWSRGQVRRAIPQR
jgi:hypothetical protein